MGSIRRDSIRSLLILIALSLATAGAAGATSLVVNRLITVSAAGSGPSNCQGLQDALAAITDAAADKPYLLKLEPGVYDCSSTVATKPFVDLEGSGQNLTRIQGTGLFLVDVADGSEIRHLTVSATAAGDTAGAVFARDAATLRHVTIEATGGTNSNFGVNCNSFSSPTLHDVRIEVADAGANNNYGIATLTSAPQLYNVYITVRDATNNYGIFAQGADGTPPTSLLVRDSRIYATGGSAAYGIYSQETVDPVVIEGSSVRVSGAEGENHALHNLDAPATVRNSVIEAAGFTVTYWAIMNERGSASLPFGGGFVVTVDNSEIIGETGTVMSEAGFTTRIGGSLLSGGNMSIDASATVTCAGVWDESYTFTAASCP